MDDYNIFEKKNQFCFIIFVKLESIEGFDEETEKVIDNEK